jgi:hypothetical protein
LRHAAAACIDWKARLALDITITKQITAEIETALAEGKKPDPNLIAEPRRNAQGVSMDLSDYLAGKCRD